MSDHLSRRVTTDTAGNVAATSGHYPYGENWYETGGTNKQKFTSYERDPGGWPTFLPSPPLPAKPNGWYR